MTLHEGRQERDRTLDLFEMSQPAWLERARTLATQLCLRHGSCTIDEVRALLPPPENADPRVCGAVFTRKLFEKCGYENSARKTCHARPIARFKLKG